MSNFRKALYSKLSTTTAITDITSTRIYPLVMPQENVESKDSRDLPAVVFNVYSNVPFYQFRKSANISRISFQIDCYAYTFQESANLAEAVRKALSGITETVDTIEIQYIKLEGESDSYEQDTKIFRVLQNYEAMVIVDY